MAAFDNIIILILLLYNIYVRLSSKNHHFVYIVKKLKFYYFK
jgi:hypothetical protein